MVQEGSTAIRDSWRTRPLQREQLPVVPGPVVVSDGSLVPINAGCLRAATGSNRHDADLRRMPRTSGSCTLSVIEEGETSASNGSIAASRLQRLYDTSKEANTALISLPLLSLFGAPGGSLLPELRIRTLCPRCLAMHPSQKRFHRLPPCMPCRINREMGLDPDRLV